MTEECDMEALQRILAVSREKNAARNITGVLFYDPAFFMQCLEGPASAVNEVYTDIVLDSRHTNVTLLEYRNAAEREFGDWSMGFQRTIDLDKETLQRFSKSGKLNPYELSSSEANDFLLEIMKRRKRALDNGER
jgi:hypothetical protein